MFDLNRLEARGKEVIFYPYRRAQVYGMIEIKCESSEERDNYREITSDNHTCFMVGDTAIMFSAW